MRLPKQDINLSEEEKRILMEAEVKLAAKRIDKITPLCVLFVVFRWHRTTAQPSPQITSSLSSITSSTNEEF